MSGLNVHFEGGDAIADITEYVAKIQDSLSEEETKKCLKQIGSCVKEAVAKYVPRSKVNHTHIADDVKAKVKQSRQSGQWYVSVGGGKDTGYKWLWVNDGHLTPDNNWIEGNHFVDKAEVMASGQIEIIVDEFLKKVLKDG